MHPVWPRARLEPGQSHGAVIAVSFTLPPTGRKGNSCPSYQFGLQCSAHQLFGQRQAVRRRAGGLETAVRPYAQQHATRAFRSTGPPFFRDSGNAASAIALL